MLEISAAIFDMDGTLVDSLMLWDVFANELAKRYPVKAGTVVSEEDSKLMRVLPLNAAMQILHDHYGIGNSGEEVSAFAAEVFMDFYANRVELKAGVLSFLSHLKERGVRMCIASATPLPLIEAALDHCGIRMCFEKIFSCADIGKGKDAPDIYYMARDYFGGDASTTWVFEDSYVAVRTAVGVGMPTVGIYDRYNPYQDLIESLSTHYIAADETLMKLV